MEAIILIKAEQPTGTVYLAGYVVEFMLKALILENLPVGGRPGMVEELKRIGHNLPRLLDIYRLKGGGRPPGNVIKQLNLVGDSWSFEMRYDPKEVKSKVAVLFLEAVDEIYRWADGRL